MKRFNFKRSFIYGAIAFLVHGGIAYYANQAYAFSPQMRATLGNGFFAWAMTFVSTLTMEFFFSIPKSPLVKYVVSFSASGLLVLFLITWLHIALGTPNMVGTIFFSALVSLPYYLLFPALLLHEWRKRTNAPAPEPHL